MSDDLPLAVDVDLPRDVKAIIKAHEAPDDGSIWTMVIYRALWEMRIVRWPLIVNSVTAVAPS